MSNSFMFSAEPRALVAGKQPLSRSATQTLRSTAQAKYRQQPPQPPQQQAEEQKECLHLNIMSDPRVYRGTNYAARSPLVITQPASSSPALHSLPSALKDQSGLPSAYSPNALFAAATTPASQPSGSTSRSASKPTKVFLRPLTPPPVTNRQHCTTQTDPYYHDLRSKPDRLSAAATQTDGELDYDTAVLFVPRSSGDDVGTEIKGGRGVVDFDRDVAVVVDVMVERALVDGLMEAGEEEEEREVARWRAEWEAKMAVEVNKLNAAITTHDRRQAEAQTRINARTQRRNQLQQQAQERQQAAQAQLEAAQAAEQQRQQAAAARPDPVVAEVSGLFVPWLMGEVGRRVGEVAGGRGAVDGLLRAAVGAVDERRRVARDERRQAEFDAYVSARYDNLPLPATSLATQAEQSQQQTYRFLQALNNQKPRSAHLTAQPVHPEDEAQRRIRARQEAARLQAKFEADVVRVQALARARRDRKRVAKLRERRELVERRKTLPPKELLKTLGVELGFQAADLAVVKAVPAAAMMAEVKEGERPSTATAPAADDGVSQPASRSSISSSPAAASSPAASRPTTAGAVVVRPTAGIEVHSVELTGAAIQAGLQAGDIITQINKTPITSTSDYSALLRTLTAGDTLTLTTYRTLSQRTDVLSIEARSAEPADYPLDEVRRLRTEAKLKAADAQPLTAETARAELEAMGAKVGFTAGKRAGKGVVGGVVVTKVVAGSGAERCGLRDGDVLVRAGSADVGSVDEFKELSGGWLAGENVLMRVVRGEGEAAEEKKIWVEIGVGTLPKKNTTEYVRALRRIAGMKVAK